ncbi:phosphatidylserine/phosphatidylglycerophosphate/cardiolipin synthase family protein [Thermogemmatispora sp.]|uniref:phospholipase D-like domain-containing protein n=1 Tax=Thermogemmatispora sp. TaxID=1968838 RepID=UPI0026388D7C|nr:phosphatidylserine/phosphatidylglycerophosphate/cardiolipin synthase family protein [Thermogemmatispora sp.]
MRHREHRERSSPTSIAMALLISLARHFSLKRLLLRTLGAILSAQAITLIILQVISRQRKRYLPQGGFPHTRFAEITIGQDHLQLYDYGRDLYDDMLAAIDSAQETIYLESYIWKDDSVGRAFKEHLIRKAEEGVAVYVIFDWFANLVVPRKFKIFPPSIHVLQYQALRYPWHLFDPRRYALDHRKLLVVDGKIGFIGGYNIGETYATSWRDTHLRIRGPAAADLAQSFVDFWNQHVPAHERITRRHPRCFNPLINVRGTSAMRLMFPIRDMYIEAIDRAQKFIYLTNAYFVPDSILLDALKAAARRGVDVEILVPWMSNHIIADWLSRSHFSECLKAGIRIFGYRHMLHAKTCTIDGEWSTIGTANLDRLSSIGNYEINVEIYNGDLARQMEVLFKYDKTNAFELSLEDWEQRPWYVRLSEWLLAPLRFLT